MRKRKKLIQNDVTVAAPESDKAIRLRFQGELLALIPTAEYPIEVLQTEQYRLWITGIANPATRARITYGVDKMRRGLFGDWKEIGAGVFEMRMDFGPGYRAYYARQGNVVIILLGGGEKSSQQKDIAEAQQLWRTIKNEVTQI